MAVIITPGRLALMINDGEENNPVIGINNVFLRTGTLSTGGATGPRALDGATYTYWVPGFSNPNLTYELGFTSTNSFAAISSHNLNEIGATARPQYWDGSEWRNAAGDAYAPAENETVIWLFEPTGATQWRMNIGDTTDSAAIAAVFIGQSLTFSRRFYRDYDEARYPTEVDLLGNVSGAHVLGTSIVGRGSTVQWDLRHLPEGDVYSDDFATWVKEYNEGRGFFSAWRPADYGTAYYGCREGGVIRLPNAGPQKRKSLSFAMRVFDG